MRSLQISYKINRRKIGGLFTSAVLLCLVAAVLSVMLGSVRLSPEQLWSAIIEGGKGSAEGRIFWYSRFPRTVACLVTGAALSVAGAVIQGVLANKLASPGIIGVNSGAGLAVTVCTVLGVYSGWQLALCSFLGAFAAVMVITAGAKRYGASKGTVILAGVALNSLLNAISQAIVTLNPDVGVMSNDFKVGDFSAVTYAKLIPAGAVIVIALLVLFTLANELDVLTLGEESAQGLGLNVNKMRTVFLIFAALLAGCAVSLAGLLSFVGLLIPHTVRKLAGGESGRLLPLCALFGAGFVTLCDLMSRTLFAPYEIPVGIIMAFIGAPFFIFILIRGRGGHGRD